MVDCQVVPYLVAFLGDKGRPELRDKSAWILTNIASGPVSHCQVLVNAGILPPLLAMLSDKNAKTCDAALWCVGNLLGDSLNVRNACIDAGVLQPLLSVLRRRVHLRNAAWALHNLCRHHPLPPPELMATIMPLLPSLLLDTNCFATHADIVGALENLVRPNPVDDNNVLVLPAISVGVLPPLLKVLRDAMATIGEADGKFHVERHLLHPGARVLGSMACTSYISVLDALVQSPVMDLVRTMLVEERVGFRVRREAAWTFSNIAAQSSVHSRRLCDAHIPEAMLDVLATPNVHDGLRSEILHTLCNLIVEGGPETPQLLLRLGVVQTLCEQIVLHPSPAPGLVASLLEACLVVTDGETREQASASIVASPIMSQLDKWQQDPPTDLVGQRATVLAQRLTRARAPAGTSQP